MGALEPKELVKIVTKKSTKKRHDGTDGNQKRNLSAMDLELIRRLGDDGVQMLKAHQVDIYSFDRQPNRQCPMAPKTERKLRTVSLKEARKHIIYRLRNKSPAGTNVAVTVQWPDDGAVQGDGVGDSADNNDDDDDDALGPPSSQGKAKKKKRGKSKSSSRFE